jgi:ubiquinone/menaquinone biosynthesis C-methylase UbiE
MTDMNTGKTHYDFIDMIGETHETARNYPERRWNQYYHKSYRFTVKRMLGDVRGKSVIDIGTSHGAWFPFLRARGFQPIYGVELDEQRAALAKRGGYDEVYHCDAKKIPHESNSFDFALSNDVFVHILQKEDKIAVLKEIFRILKPGGIFILNHTMSVAFRFSAYHIDKYCSFLSLHEFLSLIIQNTDFTIVDIKPTYYSHRDVLPGIFKKAIRQALVRAPFGVMLLFLMDYVNVRKKSLEESDTIYLKVVKQ